MASRLGQVIYWAALIAAGLMGLFAIIALLFGAPEGKIVGGIFAVLALLTWLLGRAVLYVLAAR